MELVIDETLGIFERAGICYPPRDRVSIVELFKVSIVRIEKLKAVNILGWRDRIIFAELSVEKIKLEIWNIQQFTENCTI